MMLSGKLTPNPKINYVLWKRIFQALSTRVYVDLLDGNIQPSSQPVMGRSPSNWLAIVFFHVGARGRCEYSTYQLERLWCANEMFAVSFSSFFQIPQIFAQIYLYIMYDIF